MKVTFVLQELGANPIGGIRVVYEYSNHLNKRGHQVNIIFPLVPLFPRPKDSRTFNDWLNGVKRQTSWLLYNLRNRKRVNWFDVKANLIMIPTSNPKLRRFSELFIPDADVIFATAWETAYLVNKLSMKKGKKFYLVQHYEIWDVWDSMEAWKEAEKIATSQNKRSLAMYDVVPKDAKLKAYKKMVDSTYHMPLTKIVVSFWLKQLFETKFCEKVEGPVLNGVNFETFFLEKGQRHGNHVLMSFRTPKWKGLEDGIRALKIVRKKYPEAKFSMYGVTIKKDLPEWISTYGVVSDSELRSLYNTADIFLMPSWVEGFSLPPMEAMACGCAVVSTNVGMMTMFSEDNVVLTVPPREPEVLAEKVILLLHDKEKLRQMSQAGHEYVKQFTWEKATEQLEKILKENL